jgi:hypothetical protein
MRSLQLIVLLIVVDDIGNQLLLIEAALINRVLGQVRLDHVQLAEVPPTFTLIANALLAVVVLEVMTQQLRGRLLEAELLSEAELMVMGASLGFTELADV